MCALLYLHHQESRTATSIQALFFYLSHQPPCNTEMTEEPWESVSVVLITPTAVEVEGKGQGLVCNFTGGAGWWWECPSWSQRSNLPELAAVHPPTHCKHNGSHWY